MIIVDIRRAKASPVFAGLGPPAKKRRRKTIKIKGLVIYRLEKWTVRQ